ncbi:MAG: hypothetical protein M3Q46_07805 [Verrucomicrobiota bacterium]|nr:hypothetical protein [Verrucomicrobiota bacterium]
MEPELAARLESLRAGIFVREREGVDGASRYVLQGKGKLQMAAVRALAVEMT